MEIDELSRIYQETAKTIGAGTRTLCESLAKRIQGHLIEIRKNHNVDLTVIFSTEKFETDGLPYAVWLPKFNGVAFEKGAMESFEKFKEGLVKALNYSDGQEVLASFDLKAIYYLILDFTLTSAAGMDSAVSITPDEYTIGVVVELGGLKFDA